MDIEQLRLVLETVNSVGGDAKSVAIWWLAGRFVVNVLSNAVACLALILAYRFAMKYFGHDASLREIGKAAGHRCFGPWWQVDTEATIKCIDSLKASSVEAADRAAPVPSAPQSRPAETQQMQRGGV